MILMHPCMTCDAQPVNIVAEHCMLCILSSLGLKSC